MRRNGRLPLIHRWPFYPGTGHRDETGTGPALGTKLNLPIQFGTPRRQISISSAVGWKQLAAGSGPSCLLYCGFRRSPRRSVGSLELETEDFFPLTELVLDIADAYAGGRLVSVLEGGYNLGALVDSVDVHLQTLLERDRSRVAGGVLRRRRRERRLVTP